MRYLFISLLMLWSAECIAADITFSDTHEVIWLKGEIVEGDYHRLSQAIKIVTDRPKKECLDCPECCPEWEATTLLSISSKGGDVIEAIKIGKLIREKNVWVALYHSSLCYSSCVYLLAAGLVREVDESKNVGIHRPYLRFPQEQDIDLVLN